MKVYVLTNEQDNDRYLGMLIFRNEKDAIDMKESFKWAPNLYNPFTIREHEVIE